MTKVIMTGSFRGGTGKSTVISNLATYLASLGQKTVIIDADVISPGVHAIFGLDRTSFDKTLTDFLIGNTNINDIVYDISPNLDLPESTLFIMPSSISQIDIAELLQKRNVDKFVKAFPKLINEFEPDFVLIDTHPGLNEEVLVASEIADIMFNIVRPDNQDYQGLEVSSEVAKKLGVKMIVVLNKVHPKMKNVRNKVESAFKLPVAGAIPYSEQVVLAQSQFIFSEKYPDTDFSKGISEVAANALGIEPKGHLEIMQDLLADIEKGKAKDHIKHKTFKRYTADLLSQGFIEQSKDTKLFNLTSKGKKFLKKYKTIKKFVDNFRL